MNDRRETGQGSPREGLCATCRWREEVPTARGSRFVRCGLARDDPRFAKYPPLPVIACPGYAPARREPPSS